MPYQAGSSSSASAATSTQVTLNYRKSSSPASLFRAQKLLITKDGSVVTLRLQGFTGGAYATTYITTYNDGAADNYPVPSGSRPTLAVSGKWLGVDGTTAYEFFVKINSDGSIVIAKTADFSAQALTDIDLTGQDFTITYDVTAFV